MKMLAWHGIGNLKWFSLLVSFTHLFLLHPVTSLMDKQSCSTPYFLRFTDIFSNHVQEPTTCGVSLGSSQWDASSQGCSQLSDVKLRLVPELGQARQHLLLLLRSDGHVFGRNLDFRNCPRTLELLFHFNKFKFIQGRTFPVWRS